MGWDSSPVLNFNDDNLYPTASTCALHLTLPTQHYKNYTEFEGALDTAFLYHGGFGLK